MVYMQFYSIKIPSKAANTTESNIVKEKGKLNTAIKVIT